MRSVRWSGRTERRLTLTRFGENITVSTEAGQGQTPTNEKGTAIMKLTTTTMVSVDGVMQGLGAPDEDRSGGFERGGWVAPVFDNEAMAFLNQVYQRADAFLFGRRTYEIFAGSWGTWDDPGDSPVWQALNTQPKYVVSTSLTEPKWANTTVLSGDVTAAIG